MASTDINVYIKFFRHFAERLAERYNILITFEDYVKLHKIWSLKKAKFDKRNGKKSVIGYAYIQGVKVKCVRAAGKPKVFITALPITKPNESKQTTPRLAIITAHQSNDT